MFAELKSDFKHITGMWPKTAKFADETQRLESWQTTTVIKNKIYGPSKRLIICEEGVQHLSAEKAKYDEFLKKFRSSNKGNSSKSPTSTRSNNHLDDTLKKPRGSVGNGSSQLESMRSLKQNQSASKIRSAKSLIKLVD